MKASIRVGISFAFFSQFFGVFAFSEYQPTPMPSYVATMAPSPQPSMMPTYVATVAPSQQPSMMPTYVFTVMPTVEPSLMPTTMPTVPYLGCNAGGAAPQNRGDGSWNNELYSEWISDDGMSKTIYKHKEKTESGSQVLQNPFTTITTRRFDLIWSYEELACKNNQWSRISYIYHTEAAQTVGKDKGALGHKTDSFTEITEENTLTGQPTTFYYYKWEGGEDVENFSNGNDTTTYDYTTNGPANGSISGRKRNGYSQINRTRNGTCIGKRISVVDSVQQAAEDVQCGGAM